jgi:hypothetical protein
MSVIYIEETVGDVRDLVQIAIREQVTKLELGLAMARRRLTPFEDKYGVTSERFISDMAAEDLEGGDNEYVQWAGEYQLMRRLQDKLWRLRGIEYRA